MKVGDEYYEAYVDQYEGAVEMELWIITALRGGVVHACRKNQFTWVKLSKTNGDYGWARTLGQHDRKSFPESSPPAEWARTKAAAYSKALPEVEAAIKRLTKIRATMTGQRTRARPKPKTPKVRAALLSSPSQGGETVDRSGAAAADDNHKALVEAKAQAIYEQWSDQEGFVPWVPGGNSHRQDDARQAARQALAAFTTKGMDHG